jgi:hypothetical protein
MTLHKLPSTPKCSTKISYLSLLCLNVIERKGESQNLFVGPSGSDNGPWTDRDWLRFLNQNPIAQRNALFHTTGDMMTVILRIDGSSSSDPTAEARLFSIR